MARSKVSKSEQKSRRQHEPQTPAQPPGTTVEGNSEPTSHAAASAPHSAHQKNGTAPAGSLLTPSADPNSDAAKGHAAEIAEKVKELVRLAQEQGYLTYGDINDVLPDTMVTPEDLDDIYIKLRNLEVDIVDQAEVDRIKQPEPEEDEEKTRLDILDDPVRMYLKQMGQVPLLTREQEVEISKRIETAENEIKRTIYSFGFAGKEHIALAEKLVADPPKERFDRVILDKKIEGREKHLKALRKLVKEVRI